MSREAGLDWKLVIGNLFNGVISTVAKRMTSKNPFYCQPAAFKNTMFPNCLQPIIRTSRPKPANWPVCFKNAFIGRKNQLVNFYQKNNGLFNHVL